MESTFFLGKKHVFWKVVEFVLSAEGIENWFRSRFSKLPDLPEKPKGIGAAVGVFLDLMAWSQQKNGCRGKDGWILGDLMR